MKLNVGPRESVIRLGIGVVAAASGVCLTKNPRVATLLGMAGAAGIQTGLSRYCPLNDMLGIDDAPRLAESPAHRLASEAFHA